MLPHYDVIIVTPGSAMERAYVKSLMETTVELNRLGMSYIWMNESSSLVHNARETSAGGDKRLDPNDHGPLHGQCTYNTMVWIDSDIRWSVSDFMKLVNTDYDILSGAYLLADGTRATIYTPEYPEGLPKELILGMTEITQVDAIGFGFVGIKRGVFEAMDRPWFGILHNTIMDNLGKEVHISLSEDISWCLRASHAGFTILFDPTILVGHLKTIEIGWS